MKYDQNIEWVRKVLKTGDIANTLNGGMSEAIVKLEKNADHYLLKASIPGVSVEKIKVEIIDKNLLIYHEIEFEDNDNPEMMVPHVVATCPLSPEIDFKNISASFKDKMIHIVLPFNELKTGFNRSIEIRKW